MVHFIGLMEKNMQDTGIKIKWMESVNINIQMETIMKETFKIAKEMEMENLYLLMEITMMENGY